MSSVFATDAVTWTMGVTIVVVVGVGSSVSVGVGGTRQRDLRIGAFGGCGCVHVVGNEQRQYLGADAHLVLCVWWERTFVGSNGN